MLQFHKKRSFGDFISDTFNFVKIYGKNYFKNYLLINGLLLILIMLLMVLGLKEIFGFFLSGTTPSSSYIEDYLTENITLNVVVLILMFLLFLVAPILNYTYPVLYMKRLAENQNQPIKLDDILSDTKKNLGKIFKFLLGFTFLLMPLAMVILGIITSIFKPYMMIIGMIIGNGREADFVKGLPILLIFCIKMNIIIFTFFDYLNSGRGFFGSLSYAIRSQFSYQNHRDGSPFWKYVGATQVMFIIILTITSIFTTIPMVGFFLSQEVFENASKLNDGSMAIMFIIIYSVAMLLSFILSNLIYICTGLMYYDSRTDIHRKIDLSEIDNIGKNEF